MVKRHRLITLVMLLLLYIMFPLNVFAYSDYILAGGANIGIQINTQRQIFFKIGEKSFELTLVEKRKPKN